MAESNILFVTLIGLIIMLGWLYKRHTTASKLKMPHLQFDGDNSPMRYITDTQSLMHKGYLKVEILTYRPTHILALRVQLRRSST